LIFETKRDSASGLSKRSKYWNEIKAIDFLQLFKQNKLRNGIKTFLEPNFFFFYSNLGNYGLLLLYKEMLKKIYKFWVVVRYVKICKFYISMYYFILENYD